MMDWKTSGAHATLMGSRAWAHFPQGRIVAQIFWLASQIGTEQCPCLKTTNPLEDHQAVGTTPRACGALEKSGRLSVQSF